jgi:hypothetical protein
MNCQSFQQLSVKEKIEFIGSINHALMNDEELFTDGCQLLNKAQKKGVLNNVTILPEREETNALNHLP